MVDVMVDLETMSSSSTAAIVAIGAVRMDLKNKTVFNTEPGGTFYRTVSLKSSQKFGGTIDGDTVLWWMKQSEHARAALTSDNNVSIDSALNDFAAWLREKPLEGIWGCGSDFDNVILTTAYHRLGRMQPWSYHQNRCYRTVREAANPKGIKIERAGTYHNALDDAINQANHLCKIL